MCEPWPIVWPCSEMPATVTPEMEAAAIGAAQAILWAATGRRLGLCTVTEGYVVPGGGGCGVPWLGDDRVWRNGGRTGGCCAIHLASVPVQSVQSVSIGGQVISAGGWRLDGDQLMRVGSCWPSVESCGAAPPVTVTYTHGVPLTGTWGDLAALAMSEVALDIVNGLCGGQCRLPTRAATVTRQGVTVSPVIPEGKLGLPMTDRLVDVVNPHRRVQRSQVYSPDMARRVL